VASSGSKEANYALYSAPDCGIDRERGSHHKKPESISGLSDQTQYTVCQVRGQTTPTHD